MFFGYQHHFPCGYPEPLYSLVYQWNYWNLCAYNGILQTTASNCNDTGSTAQSHLQRDSKGIMRIPCSKSWVDQNQLDPLGWNRLHQHGAWPIHVPFACDVMRSQSDALGMSPWCTPHWTKLRGNARCVMGHISYRSPYCSWLRMSPHNRPVYWPVWIVLHWSVCIDHHGCLMAYSREYHHDSPLPSIGPLLTTAKKYGCW